MCSLKFIICERVDEDFTGDSKPCESNGRFVGCYLAIKVKTSKCMPRLRATSSNPSGGWIVDSLE